MTCQLFCLVFTHDIGARLLTWLLAGAVARIKSRSLVEAWSSWLAFCEQRQAKREQLAAAVSFWRHRELATAFADFRYAAVNHATPS